MRIKFIDVLFVSILTIGTGTTVFNLSSSKKISSALLASATSTIAGLYVVGSKKELESKINTLIDVSKGDRSSGCWRGLPDGSAKQRETAKSADRTLNNLVHL